MPEFSQYQNVFRIAKKDSASNGTQSPAMKRNRQTVSCSACRTRKLKCDRQTPCMTCVKRGDVTLCNYSHDSRNGRDRRDGGSRASEAQLRLQKLEEMVTTLLQTTKDRSQDGIPSHNVPVDHRLTELSVQSTPHTTKASSQGRLDIHGSEINYLDATHWVTILENIRGIQDVLEPGIGDSEDTSASALQNGPDILLDTTLSLTLKDVFNSLPPKSVTDKLLSTYFNSKYTQIPCFHSGKFAREYNLFWVNPSSISFLWISMLFSALYIGSQINQANGQGLDDSSDNPATLSFFAKAGQALVTGKYHKGRPYSVEAVLLYAFCKFMQSKDQDTDACMFFGISARLAMRMGYHREPRHLAHISPFEGEMRRRTFVIIETFDLLLSFQAGLPAVIHEEECDTEPPSNLFDTDFEEDCTSLPPSRPSTDSTPMLYYCYKSRLARVFRRVVRHALSFKRPSYENTLRIDKELQATHNDVPPSLRLKPFDSSIMDPAYMIFRRMNTELLYLKSLCVLHRPYLNYNRSNPAFEYSRKTCSDAALQILKHQAEINVACAPGNQLHDDSWMLSSLWFHDFLLAAMTTCLDLCESYSNLAKASPEELEAQVRKHDALKFSLDICKSRRAFSRDARRASKILAAMLSKVPRPNNPNISLSNISSGVPTGSQFSMNHGNVVGRAANASDHSSWNTSGFDAAGQELFIDENALQNFNSADSLNSIFTEFDNIDWGFVDQRLLGRNGDDDDHGLLDLHLQDGVGEPPVI